MTKKSVTKRIPVFSVKAETIPHCEHRIFSFVGVEPHVKYFVPMIKNIMSEFYFIRRQIYSENAGFGQRFCVVLFRVLKED